MPGRAAIKVVGESLLNAAKTVCSAACGSSDRCVAVDTAAEVCDLVVDLTRHGFHDGVPHDLANWLPDHDWVPAMWGIQSSTRHVQMAACHNALRAALATYDDVLLNRRLPAEVVAYLTRQRERISAMDQRLQTAIKA